MTKPKKMRCALCKCKINLLQITINTCLCGSIFCTDHRLPEDHDCAYDFKNHHRVILERENPKIERPQVSPI